MVSTSVSQDRVGRYIAAAMVVVGLAALVGVRPAWITSPRTVAATRIGPVAVVPVPLSPVRTPLVGSALTPPMGWNGFNRFYVGVNARTVEAAARTLVGSGMMAAGYTYVNLDGGWALRRRNAEGSLQADPAKFPQGIRPVADYVHALGLKFGIYTSAGTENCAGTSAGSYGHYRDDAITFASWGVDYLKLDWCNIPARNYPELSPRQISELLATQMRDALAPTGRAIVYDVNDWAGDEPWSWAPGLANLWRTTPDIHDKYPSMVRNFIHNVGHYEYAGPNAWNDPDMLEIGNGGMSTTEYESQFSLWAEMAAPLIAGNDLTTMSPVTVRMLTNSAVIAVDQDSLGRQGYPVASDDGHWVLTKPLANGDRAVVLFNQTDAAVTISTTTAQVGLATGTEYTLLDLWSGTSAQTASLIDARVPAHGVVFYRITRSAVPDQI